MTFLPVVERELRAAARKRYTYWSRFVGASVALTLGAWIWGWLAAGQHESARGQVLFKAISELAFTYSILAGIGITSDCLSEEKREGTLGLLFLTDLKGYDVVFGKLTATSINALYRLFSVFPVLSVPLLLGGLTLTEVGRMALALTNALFFSLSAGIFASAISLRERRAMVATVLLILATTAAPPLLGFFVYSHDRTIPYSSTWLWSSTVYPATLSLDKPYKLDPNGYWSSIVTTQALAWAFLLGSSLVVRRAWQDRPVTGRAAQWRDWWSSWQFGARESRRVVRQQLLDINPMLWRSGRDRLKTVFVMAFLILAGLIWYLFARKFSSNMFDPTVYFLTAYTLHAVLKLWLASEACRPFTEDRRTGGLELVLSTPMTVDEILEGELLALKRQFTWPAGVILAADLIMLVAGTHDRLLESSNDWLFLCFGIMIMFVADLYTLAWVGMWLGLTAKKGTRAVAGTIGRVLVLPWAVFLFGLSAAAILQWRGLDETSELGLLTTAFLVALLFDAIFFNWAKSNLRSRFRLVATQRFQDKATSMAGVNGVEVAPAASPPVLV